MKNATKIADEIKALCKKLLKDGKPEPRLPLEPLSALVRGALSYDVPDSRVEEALKVIDHEFVDLNELRVATELEVQEMLGTRYPRIEQRVTLVTTALNNIFEREHTLSLDRLKAVPKKEARQFLRELPEIPPFVEAYVMLFGLECPAFPIDDTMLTYLKEEGIATDATTLVEAQKQIENAIKGDDLYDFYAVLRRAALTKKKK